MKKAVGTLFALGLLPGAGWSQVLLGPEFQINIYTTNYQTSPSIATDDSGNFVVVWRSTGQDGSLGGIVGRRYSASGVPGDEFLVNDYTTGQQVRPAVASDSDGNFVVVWESHDGDGYGVWAQRYDATGMRQGGQFRINDFTTGLQSGSAVAMAGSGNFVVVWGGLAAYSNYDIWGQRFSAAGAPQGANFRVNAFVTGAQLSPALASDDAGNFVVVWQDYYQDGSGTGLFGRRFDASGVALTGEFPVNSYTTGSQQQPAVALSAEGSFMVTWADYDRNGNQWDVFGQFFTASGSMQGTDFRVNSSTTGWQEFPAVGLSASGDFIVAWGDSGASSDGEIRSRRYDSAGSPIGAEFQVNSSPVSAISGPSVAAVPAGSFVVTWESFALDGSDLGILGQRLILDLIFADGFE